MTLKYRAAFTKAIRRIKKANPNDPIIVWMDTMIKSGRFLDYYEAQDALGVRMGIEFKVGTNYDMDYEKTIDWEASLQYNSKNALGEKEGPRSLGNYKSEAKAYEYVAKQHLYKLNEVDNIIERFTSRSI